MFGQKYRVLSVTQYYSQNSSSQKTDKRSIKRCSQKDNQTCFTLAQIKHGFFGRKLAYFCVKLTNSHIQLAYATQIRQLECSNQIILQKQIKLSSVRAITKKQKTITIRYTECQKQRQREVYFFSQQLAQHWYNFIYLQLNSIDKSLLTEQILTLQKRVSLQKFATTFNQQRILIHSTDYKRNEPKQNIDRYSREIIKFQQNGKSIYSTFVKIKVEDSKQCRYFLILAEFHNTFALSYAQYCQDLPFEQLFMPYHEHIWPVYQWKSISQLVKNNKNTIELQFSGLIKRNKIMVSFKDIQICKKWSYLLLNMWNNRNTQIKIQKILEDYSKDGKISTSETPSNQSKETDPKSEQMNRQEIPKSPELSNEQSNIKLSESQNSWVGGMINRSENMSSVNNYQEIEVQPLREENPKNLYDSLQSVRKQIPAAFHYLRRPEFINFSLRNQMGMKIIVQSSSVFSKDQAKMFQLTTQNMILKRKIQKIERVLNEIKAKFNVKKLGHSQDQVLMMSSIQNLRSFCSSSGDEKLLLMVSNQIIQKSRSNSQSARQSSSDFIRLRADLQSNHQYLNQTHDK